jgi:hypothetical protein
MSQIPAETKAILLGFERGVRRIDASKSYPSALKEASGGRQVLDWILSALLECGIQDVVFVGGYHIEKVMERYPRLRFYYHPWWQNGSYSDALSRVLPELHGPCLISETDLLFRAPLVRGLLPDASGGVRLGVQEVHPQVLPPHRRVVVAVRAEQATGFRVPSESCGVSVFYSGMMSLDRAAVEVLRGIVGREAGKSPGSLPELLGELCSGVNRCRVCFLGEELAHASDPGSVSEFVLGSKAKTLERLRPMVRKSRILEQVCFSVREWKDHSDRILQQVEARSAWNLVVVRSSALIEDSRTESQAGRFQTVLGVDPGNRVAVRTAIDMVVQSYGETEAHHDANEVFVQPQLTSVKLSGVCLTRDLETGAPYVVVNYDRTADQTEGVTSGAGARLHTVIVSRVPEVAVPEDSDLCPVLEAVAELESLIGLDALDVEFAVDPSGACTVFQVRPLAVRRGEAAADDADYAEEIGALRRYLAELSRPVPGLHGSRTLLGTMPDWNPAEIIGICPRPLALSLYQTLITDEIWGAARAEIGYRDTFPTPLLIALAGRPYIDVRASLNSFLPAELEEGVGSKLVEGSLRHLIAHPELHDKIEFDVAITCLAFDFDRHAGRLGEYGLTEAEIRHFRKALLDLTDPLISGRRRPIGALLQEVGRLSARREAILRDCPRSPDSLPRTVRRLLHECRAWGTLQFSILARYAFIATTFLRSLVVRNVLSDAEYGDVLAGIPTVTTQVSEDLRGLSDGRVSRSDFLRLYGHLRPGTYNILSPSYLGAPDKYLQLPAAGTDPPSHRPAMEILSGKSAAIEALLQEEGFRCSAPELRDFILESIPAREWAKFEFSRNLSQALDLLSEFGARLDLTAEEVSFLPAELLLRLGTDSPSPALRTDLLRLAGTASKRYRLSAALRLPHLIRSSSDLDSFEVLEWHPNYVTAKRVTARVTVLDGSEGKADLRGKVVAIMSADPGYDWIFGHPIAGLITQYGGVASHMAVRAAEFQLPAAIGCGEVIYKRVTQAHVVELDCAARQIRTVR